MMLHQLQSDSPNVMYIQAFYVPPLLPFVIIRY